MSRWRVNPTTARLLRKLNTDGYIAQSTLSKGAVNNINLLIDQGILGRDKKRIIVRRQDDLAEIVSKIVDPPETLNHAEAARFYGDAHRGGRQPNLALLLRTRGPCLWRQLNLNTKMETSIISKTMGVASIAITPEDDWYCDQPIAFVENEYCLWRCETFPLPAEVSGVITYHGTADTRLIEWLGYRSRAPKVFWCPDYDYVGLSNYVRAKAKADVILWVPDQLEELLNSTAKNPARLENQQHLLPQLLHSEDTDVQRVLKLLISAGGGIDHEAFIDRVQS